MRFCPNCDNILRSKEKNLYCKTCDEFFNLDKQQNDHNVSKIKKKRVSPPLLNIRIVPCNRLTLIEINNLYHARVP